MYRQEKADSRQSNEPELEGEGARPREDEPYTDLSDEEVQIVKTKTKQSSALPLQGLYC